MDLPKNQDGIEEPRNEEDGRIRQVADKAKDTLGRAKDGLVAGASGVAEVSRTVASETRERAGQVVDFVREAETDQELKANVTHRTESSLERAGDALIGAAPTVGRGAERAAELTGHALNRIAHPFAAMVGAIAGTVGGWWKKAAEDGFEMSAEDEEACRAHFTAVVLPAGGVTYDGARPGYALGYVAARNPEYRGRRFEEVEPELRRGFGEEHVSDYEGLRDYIQFGYGRGAGGGA